MANTCHGCTSVTRIANLKTASNSLNVEYLIWPAGAGELDDAGGIEQ